MARQRYPNSPGGRIEQWSPGAPGLLPDSSGLSSWVQKKKNLVSSLGIICLAFQIFIFGPFLFCERHFFIKRRATPLARTNEKGLGVFLRSTPIGREGCVGNSI